MSSALFPVSAILVNGRKRLATPEKVESLAESIKQLGLLNPLTITPEGWLVAGLHRLKAIQWLGWQEVPVTIVTLDSLLLELAEIDENLIRQPLTMLQKGVQIARRKEIYEALYPQTKHGANGRRGSGNGVTVSRNDTMSFSENTASQMSQSERTIERLAMFGAVLQDVDHRLENSPIANNQKALITLAQMDEEEREEVIEKLETREALTIQEARRLIHQEEEAIIPDDMPACLIDRCTFLCGEIDETEHLVDDESVDCIITAPPDDLEAYEELATMAARVLKAGALLCTVNQALLPDVLPVLMARLSYRWTIALLYDHPKEDWQSNVRTSWEPVLWLAKGDCKGRAIEDTAKSLAGLLERFTKPGDIVLDPFMGGGAIVVPAVQMNRRVVGIGSLDALETTLKKLRALQE